MEAASQRTLKMLHMFGQPRDSSVVILLQRNQKMFQLICIKNKIKKKKSRRRMKSKAQQVLGTRLPNSSFAVVTR